MGALIPKAGQAQGASLCSGAGWLRGGAAAMLVLFPRPGWCYRLCSSKIYGFWGRLSVPRGCFAWMEPGGALCFQTLPLQPVSGKGHLVGTPTRWSEAPEDQSNGRYSQHLVFDVVARRWYLPEGCLRAVWGALKRGLGAPGAAQSPSVTPEVTRPHRWLLGSKLVTLPALPSYLTR